MTQRSEGEGDCHPSAFESDSGPLALDRQVPWELLGYPEEVDIARRWYGPLAFTGNENQIPANVYSQYVSSVWQARGYKPSDQLSEREQELYRQWINRDLGKLSLLGGTPRESRLREYDEAAQLGYLLVTNTLTQAYQLNADMDLALERQHTQQEREDLQTQVHEWSGLALHDPLTGHLNRRGLEKIREAFARRLARTQGVLPAQERRVSETADRNIVAEFDVDITYFKHVNDVFGHEFGDNCIKEAMDEVLEGARAEDEPEIGRYGGDEFILFLGNTSEGGYRAFSDRILNQQFAKIARHHGFHGEQLRATDQPEMSRYERMWRRIEALRQYVQQWSITEEDISNTEGGPAYTAKVLRLGGHYIGPLRDILVLGVGSAHTKQIGNVLEMQVYADRLLMQHKQRLHARMSVHHRRER